MKNTKIIGISGTLGSGKGTFAELFAELSQTFVEKHAFADKVREVTETLTGYKRKIVNQAGQPFFNTIYNYTQDDKNFFLPSWNKTVGECLQKIGTEALRENFDYDVWVKCLFETVGKECLEKGHILCIDDVRFPNEADYVISQGGIVVRLEGDPLDIRKNSKRDLNHISETALNDYTKFSKVIVNDVPDLDAFREKVRNFINEIS